MKSKEELEKEKRALEKRLKLISDKLEKLNKPNPIGFRYKAKC